MARKKYNLLRLPAVCTKTGLSKPTVYRLMKDKCFPVSIKLSPRAVAWVEEDIDDWIESRQEKV